MKKMITAFFKPKSQKVTPVTSNEVISASDDEENRLKRCRDEGKDEEILLSNAKKRKSESTSETDEIISYLDRHESDEHTWRAALEKHFGSSSFGRLAKFVSEQRKSLTVFPPAPDIFSALNLTPLDKVKVVIVGQDPYHGPHQAHGLCFSVRKGVPIPPSLRNIYKELIDDPKITNFTHMPTHGFLERWAKQGVLMINTVLTVRKGEANSHKGQGWELVTDEIIRAVDQRKGKNKKGVVFLLWGIPAMKKTKTALGGSSSSRHRIICTSHPSPLGATKTESPFLTSQCFSKANEALMELGYDGDIDWRVDGPL